MIRGRIIGTCVSFTYTRVFRLELFDDFYSRGSNIDFLDKTVIYLPRRFFSMCP